MNDIQDYMDKYPGTISMYMIDFNDRQEVNRVAKLMRETNVALDDSIFDMPSGALA